MFATGVTMGLAEWIIDDTCLASVKKLETLLDSKKLSATLLKKIYFTENAFSVDGLIFHLTER